jgi:hypothetical protein
MTMPVGWPRRLLVTTLVGLAACLAVTADEGRFRVIASESPESLQRKLNAVGAIGYHAIAAGRGSALSGKGRTVVLLKRNETAAATYEYRVLEISGLTDSFVPVSELGKAGFRVKQGLMLAELPDDWWSSQSDYDDHVQLILERSDASAAYDYDVFAYENPTALERKLTEFMKQGYDVIGLLNSVRRLRIVLERDLRAEPVDSETTMPAGGRYQLIIGSLKVGLRHQINDASARGYRVASVAETGTHAPPMMLLEKVAKTGRTLEYKPLYEPGQRILNEKLEKKLNKRARKGFRITPGAISRSVVVMERIEQTTPAQYRTLSSRTPPGLSENLQSAAEQGYRPITMFVSGDQTTVVVEKPGS